MELNHINVWLLAHEDGWMLVDTGLAEDVCREAWRSLELNDLGGRLLRRVFLTHDHPDHMGLARWLHDPTCLVQALRQVQEDCHCCRPARSRGWPTRSACRWRGYAASPAFG